MRTRQRSRKTIAWLSTLALVSAVLGAVAVPAATATVVYPNLVKVFDPDIVGPGSSTTLTFTISNSGGASPVDNIAFSDTLPGDLVIATPSSASSDCDGVLTAPDGGTTISLSGGKVGTGMECTITVNITSGDTQDDPAHTNTTSSLTWGTAGTGDPASDDLEVSGSRPGFTKVFSPSSIGVGDTSTLTFTIDNSDNGSDLHSIDFSDELPDDVIIATPANAATTCFGTFGGTLTADPGTNVVFLFAFGSATNPSVDEGASCTVDVDVIGASPGTYDNVSTELKVDTSSLTDASAGFATAALEVTLDEPAIDIQKTPDSQTILVGEDATWTIEVTNTGRLDLTGVEVTDTLAPGCDRVIGALAVDATVSYNCSLAGVSAGFTNVAAVTGTDGESTANDSDDAKVVVVPSGLSIDKTPDVQTIEVGATAVFTITVSNTSGVVLEDVVVSDPLAPDCDRTFDLGVGAVVSYTCTLAGVTDDFVNSATVSWTDPLPPTSSPVEALTAAPPPGISIVKAPNEQNLPPGGTASWTITVFNTGASSVDVIVDDPIAPDCDNDLGTLGFEESVSYTCTLDNVTGSFTNTANAEATLTSGGSLTADATASDSADVIVELTDTDTATVNVRQAEIDIQKTPSIQEIDSGETASWTIIVTNTGRDTLTNVAVSDPLAADCDATIGTLAESESVSYDCELTGVTDDFVNVATVTADGPEGSSLEVSDSASVVVSGPDIEIQKTPNSQVVVTGGTAVFTITVINTGDDDLINVEVTDAASPDCDEVIGALAAATFFSYTCTQPGVTADFTNTAIVTGDVDDGPTVTDSDDALVEVDDPSIDISKKPPTQQVPVGGTATWTIRVTNTSRIDLIDVEVTDPLAPNCDRVIGNLGAGAFQSYTCTFSPVATSFTNKATVTASDGATTVGSVDEAQVVATEPGLEITKTPDTQTIDSGDTANFTITVKNTGTASISGVEVSDPLAPDCSANLGTLAPSAEVEYDCELLNVTESFENVATVSAAPSGGGELEFFDEDTAEVIVRASEIDIQKDPSVQLVASGETAEFTITVTNTGRGSLTDVTVSDPLSPDCDRALGTILEGDSVSYTCERTGVTASFVNVATASGTSAEGAVSGSDSATVDVSGPEIIITKTPPVQRLLLGETAHWVITVENTGDEDLTDVLITDPLAPDCGRFIGDLDVEAMVSYSCILANVQEAFTNVATAEGDHASGGGGTVSNEAEADVLLWLCDGEPVTIIGTVNDDVLMGTDGPDVIWGASGNDLIFGMKGDDLICGGSGNDRIAGNEGDDRILGGSGNDTALYTMAAASVFVNLGGNTATGGDGTDTVAQIENAVGSPFADVLKGDAGDNILAGGDQDDVLIGKMGDDTLLGQLGDDRMNGGLGDDALIGSTGEDWGIYTTAPVGVRVDLRIFGPQVTRYGRDTLSNIEHLSGSQFNDILGGNTETNWLIGRKGRDILLGRGNDDILIGNAGIDAAFGAAGIDTCAAEFEVNCEL